MLCIDASVGSDLECLSEIGGTVALVGDTKSANVVHRGSKKRLRISRSGMAAALQIPSADNPADGLTKATMLNPDHLLRKQLHSSSLGAKP